MPKSTCIVYICHTDTHKNAHAHSFVHNPPGKKDAPSSTGVRAGDGVRVELDPEVFKAAQEEHGGWGDHMAEVRGHM